MNVDDRIETFLRELDTKLELPSYEYDILNDVKLSSGTQSHELKENLLKEIEKLDTPYFDRHHLEALNVELFVDNVLTGLCHISASYRCFSGDNSLEKYRYYSIGVGLIDLLSGQLNQFDLFNQPTSNPALMNTLDMINHRYGNDTVFFVRRQLACPIRVN
jgi:hypothetical protein